MRPDEYYNSMAVELKKIEDEILQLKKRQPNGNDTVQTYANQNSGWDVDWTPTFPAGQQRDINKSILFRASEQVAPVSQMRYYMLVDGEPYTIGSFDDPFKGKAAVNGYVHDNFLSYPNLQPTPGLDAWYFNVTVYQSGVNIKIRFIIDSTDTGTITTMDV